MAHSARLRVEALKRVFKRGEKVSSVCLSLDILPRTFYRWKRKFLSLPKERREEILASEVPPSEWKIKPSDLRLEILKLVVSYPGLSSRLIYEKLLEEGLKVSPTAFVNFLRRHKLATKNQRREYAVLYESIHSTRASVPQKGVNLAQRRKRMVEEVIYAGRPVVDVCYEFGVSGPTFYKWKERYRQAVKKDENLLEAMEDQLLTGAEHPRGISKKLERKILDNVILNPRSSSIKLAKYLPVTNHGIQNVLARNGLNHQPSRELFATQVRNGEVDYPLSLRLRWAFVWENVWQLPKFTFHYWPRMVGGWLLLGLAALVTGGGLYGWLKVVFTTPGAAPLGLFFASISLAIGGIFFLYSFKYYFSLALVLSFSRRKGLRGGLLNGSGLPWVSNASGNNEEVLEMSSQDDSRNDSRRRLGLIDRITRLGNPVTRREDGGIRGAGGVWKWLFGSSVRDNANSSLINGEIGELELERKPFVSIHLPMFNEKRVARRVIEACASMEYFDEQGRPHFEVLVCDDSTDETVEIVEQVAEEINSKLKVSSFAKATEDRQKSKTYNLQPTTRQPARQAYNLVRVLHRPTREGFKGGALKHALETMDPRTEFIMVFDADFVPFSDTIDQFLRHFQFVCKGLSIKEIKKSKAAAVTGYQWHVLNKGENWVTKGVRTEYSGSYLVERPARELMGGLKIIHGSVYMIRADVLKETGWGTSITEDFELTLRLYEKGYKVVFTPYVQAPAECVSTIKRLIRQRMRWAEGHGNNVRKMFKRLMLGKWEESEKLKVKSEKLQAPSYATMQPCNYDKQKKHSYIARWLHSLVGRAPSRASRFVPSPLSFMEKIELLYLAPYYLQAALFLIGNISWLVAELVFRTSLPFWTSIWGWSMVLTNLFALPLVNSVGLFIEESEKDDYLGILSFVALCYLLVPFQAYASVKGFIEKEEGTWFRTPKTGKVTISLMRSRFARLVKIFFPLGDNQEQSPISVEKTTTSRRSALNIFDGLSGSAQKLRPALYGVGHTTLLVLLLISTVLFNFAPLIESGSAPIIGNSLGIAYA
ncbi:glycosyltransferase, partial [Patescibacteria group bacterium]|nr:glycosyltransferase [Patescibacteria group bacterium]